jgi:hypothetical protein
VLLLRSCLRWRQVNWGDRPRRGRDNIGMGLGVPLEDIILLTNTGILTVLAVPAPFSRDSCVHVSAAVGANPWLNIPHAAVRGRCS